MRQGLRTLLEAAGDITVVGEAGLAADATARIPALRPDVAVLDARLPDGSGIDVCREVRSADPRIRALVLTSYDDDDALFTAIMAGAAGYVLKQIQGDALLEGVRRVAAGQSLIDPALTARVVERFTRGPEETEPGEEEQLASLTAQERRIFALIAEGLTNRQIGERLFLAEKTVKNYVSGILSKLGMQRRTQAAVLAIKGTTRLLQNDYRLRESIRLRNPYVDPISLLQVDLLARWRAADRPEDALFHALVTTVNGIAAGVQNTG